MQPTPMQKELRNPQTEAHHRREVFWQITVPLIIGGAIFVGFVILTIFSSAARVSQNADVALIWLMPLPMLMCLLTVALLGAMVYGLWKLIVILPGKMFQLQNLFKQIQSFVRMVSDKLVEPFLKAHSAAASAGAFKKNLLKKGS
jgi:hypothetical protein